MTRRCILSLPCWKLQKWFGRKETKTDYLDKQRISCFSALSYVYVHIDMHSCILYFGIFVERKLKEEKTINIKNSHMSATLSKGRRDPPLSEDKKGVQRSLEISKGEKLADVSLPQ